MPLTKQVLNINFSKGLDTKTDPWQVPAGNFLSLENSIFDEGGMLKKRNGFGNLLTTDSSPTTLSTHNGNLVAIGDRLEVLSAGEDRWFDRGPIQSVDLDTIPLVRQATPQSTVDTAMGPDGSVCVAFTDTVSGASYQIVDGATGQILVSATTLETGAKHPRVFALGSYFVITYLVLITATPTLRYVSIPVNDPTSPASPVTLSATVEDIDAGYDGVVTNGRLYIAYSASDMGGAIRTFYLSSTLVGSSEKVIAGYTSAAVSVCADISLPTPNIWVTFYDDIADVYSALYDYNLTAILAATVSQSSTTASTITTTATNGTVTVFTDQTTTHTTGAFPTHVLRYSAMTSAGVVVTAAAILYRGLGLASKAFTIAETGKTYVLGAFGRPLQPSYYLIEAGTGSSVFTASGSIIGLLAYSNGGGWYGTQVLPSVTVNGTAASMGYLYKVNLIPANKSQGSSIVNGAYAQIGCNLATFDINSRQLQTVEIAGSLMTPGGFLWMYDGAKPVETGFFLFPEDLSTATATTGGSMTAQIYYYIAVFEWTDAQGNIHRSAPSVPVVRDISASGTSTNTVTVTVPSLWMTYKTTPNPVRIVLYRWSTAQQIYYQCTSTVTPTLNSPTAATVSFTDTQADSSIAGNNILYTTGGTVENIIPPACKALALYKSRLMLIPAENPNNLWYSKQVIPATPVEMSDLFTLFVSPTTGAQGSTGNAKVIVPMDDKIISYKPNAIYYNTGTGPDNTGANNDFSEPVFITSTVGCSNPNSTAMIPQGIMFESNKGIWLLGRDLSTKFIGAPVEQYTESASVLSAVVVPNTNQVRFTMSSGKVLMYDYYYGQWGVFSNIPGVSSTIFQDTHTYLNPYGTVRMETPDLYLDGTQPVLMQFTTSWLNMAGLQGYERAYFFYLLAKYYSPHKLVISVAYDYDNNPRQQTTIDPNPAFLNAKYGDDSPYGGVSPYGGESGPEQYRVFLSRQQCQAFRISVQEQYDASYSVPAGAGFTMSGLAAILGIKGNYPKLKATRSVG